MAVRHYQLTLTAVGPIHIGNGQTIGKKDYFNLDGKTLGILDVERFFDELNPDEREEYCEFLERDSHVGLDEFLSRRQKFRSCAHANVKYSIEATLSKSRRGDPQYLEARAFVKDGEGRPYVPGSSVKGMIRTALLTHVIQNNRAGYMPLYDGRKARNREDCAKACRAIERKAFWREGPTGDADDFDIMRYISVSDSQPLSTADLAFAKKYDKFSRGDSGRHKRNMGKLSDYEGNELNIYRECLKPGTKLEFSLDVDDRIDAHLGGLSLDGDGIIDVLRESFELYQKRFLDMFDLEELGKASEGNGSTLDDGRCCYIYTSGPFAGSRCRNRAVGGTGYCNSHQDQVVDAAAEEDNTQVYCLLGGGTDFGSKTVLQALFEEADDAVGEIAQILYAQFPTRVNQATHPVLFDGVRDAGFDPRPFSARGKQKKEDHRHWMDVELGVSPHTAKLGIVSGKKYPMGRCTVEIEERVA